MEETKMSEESANIDFEFMQEARERKREMEEDD